MVQCGKVKNIKNESQFIDKLDNAINCYDKYL